MFPRLWLSPALGLMGAAGLMTAFASGVLLAADQPPAPPSAPAPSPLPPPNTVVARVDGTELRLSDVEAAQQSLPPQDLFARNRRGEEVARLVTVSRHHLGVPRISDGLYRPRPVRGLAATA